MQAPKRASKQQQQLNVDQFKLLKKPMDHLGKQINVPGFFWQGRMLPDERDKRSTGPGKTKSFSLTRRSRERFSRLSEIHNRRNRLDNMAQRQTRQCKYQVKQREAKEYLRDKKGPSKFCGNTLSLQAPKELVQSMPVGILRITQGPTTITDELITRIQRAIPSIEIQVAEGEAALLILTIPEERAYDRFCF